MLVYAKSGPAYNFTWVPMTRYQLFYQKVKRCLDFLISGAALLVLAIPFCMVALCQKLDSPKEPVFFRQLRVGREGRLFHVTKFRTMRSDAPHDVATENLDHPEQYSSKFGRFLRKTSIDELPQLFQVFTGHMSLIGPRPLIPDETEAHAYRHQSGVYQLRPGLSGLAQINGRDYLDGKDKVFYDREYLKHYGLRQDCKIIRKSIGNVLLAINIK